jgi:hypothetical protein
MIVPMHHAPDTHSHATAQVEELLDAIAAAETVIITTIERECEALRAGRMLAAQALHTRLCDAVKLYLGGMKSARASLWTIDQLVPGSRDVLEERRVTFAATMKLELAVLATERAAHEGVAPTTSFTGESLSGAMGANSPPARPPMPRAVPLQGLEGPGSGPGPARRHAAR